MKSGKTEVTCRKKVENALKEVAELTQVEVVELIEAIAKLEENQLKSRHSRP